MQLLFARPIGKSHWELQLLSASDGVIRKIPMWPAGEIQDIGFDSRGEVVVIVAFPQDPHVHESVLRRWTNRNGAFCSIVKYSKPDIAVWTFADDGKWHETETSDQDRSCDDDDDTNWRRDHGLRVSLVSPELAIAREVPVSPRNLPRSIRPQLAPAFITLGGERMRVMPPPPTMRNGKGFVTSWLKIRSRFTPVYVREQRFYEAGLLEGKQDTAFLHATAEHVTELQPAEAPYLEVRDRFLFLLDNKNGLHVYDITTGAEVLKRADIAAARFWPVARK